MIGKLIGSKKLNEEQMNMTPEEGNDNAPLVERITTRHGTHTIDYAEKIGMGSKTYELIMIDEE